MAAHFSQLFVRFGQSNVSLQVCFVCCQRLLEVVVIVREVRLRFDLVLLRIFLFWQLCLLLAQLLKCFDVFLLKNFDTFGKLLNGGPVRSFIKSSVSSLRLLNVKVSDGKHLLSTLAGNE